MNPFGLLPYLSFGSPIEPLAPEFPPKEEEKHGENNSIHKIKKKKSISPQLQFVPTAVY